MATPASGSIGMGHFHSEITRSSGQLSMSTVRTRYGGTGQISFSELRKAEGFTITVGSAQGAGSKFEPAVDEKGYANNFSYKLGSVTPGEVNTKIEFTANCYLSRFSSTRTDTFGTLQVDNTTSDIPENSTMPTGFRGDNITRIVAANTSRTITSGSENFAGFTYQFPSTDGTVVHCLVKF